jgi:hypothetical protein
MPQQELALEQKAEEVPTQTLAVAMAPMIAAPTEEAYVQTNVMGTSVPTAMSKIAAPAEEAAPLPAEKPGGKFPMTPLPSASSVDQMARALQTESPMPTIQAPTQSQIMKMTQTVITSTGATQAGHWGWRFVEISLALIAVLSGIIALFLAPKR